MDTVVEPYLRILFPPEDLAELRLHPRPRRALGSVPGRPYGDAVSGNTLCGDAGGGGVGIPMGGECDWTSDAGRTGGHEAMGLQDRTAVPRLS